MTPFNDYDSDSDSDSDSVSDFGFDREENDYNYGYAPTYSASADTAKPTQAEERTKKELKGVREELSNAKDKIFELETEILREMARASANTSSDRHLKYDLEIAERKLEEKSKEIEKRDNQIRSLESDIEAAERFEELMYRRAQEMEEQLKDNQRQQVDYEMGAQQAFRAVADQLRSNEEQATLLEMTVQEKTEELDGLAAKLKVATKQVKDRDQTIGHLTKSAQHLSQNAKSNAAKIHAQKQAIRELTQAAQRVSMEMYNIKVEMKSRRDEKVAEAKKIASLASQRNTIFGLFMATMFVFLARIPFIHHHHSTTDLNVDSIHLTDTSSLAPVRSNIFSCTAGRKVFTNNEAMSQNGYEAPKECQIWSVSQTDCRPQEARERPLLDEEVAIEMDYFLRGSQRRVRRARLHQSGTDVPHLCTSLPKRDAFVEVNDHEQGLGVGWVGLRRTGAIRNTQQMSTILPETVVAAEPNHFLQGPHLQGRYLRGSGVFR